MAKKQKKEPTTHDIPINEGQVKLFQQIDAGLADLVTKRDAMLTVVLAGAGFNTGTFTLLGYDFEEGLVKVELPVPKD